VLPKRHKQTIDLDPIIPRQFFLELSPDLISASRFHVSPTRRHSPDMDVDAYSLVTSRDAEREVRALWSDSLE
jgi:hypothetical protein